MKGGPVMNNPNQPQNPNQNPMQNQIMDFLNDANENNWREESYRNRVIFKISISWDRKQRPLGGAKNYFVTHERIQGMKLSRFTNFHRKILPGLDFSNFGLSAR